MIAATSGPARPAVWVAFDGRHRGRHDTVARTLVVHA